MLQAFASIHAQFYLIRNIIFCYINYKFESDSTEFPRAFFLEEEQKSQSKEEAIKPDAGVKYRYLET